MPLTLPEIPRSTPDDRKPEDQVPWIVRSILHGRGVPHAEVTPRRFAAMTAAELADLERWLLAEMNERTTKDAVQLWTRPMIQAAKQRQAA